MSPSTSPSDSHDPLAPARYGDESKGLEAYQGAFPWRVLLGILVVFAGVIGLHTQLTQRKVERLREDTLARIEAEIVPLQGELEALRARVSALVLERYRRAEVEAPFVSEGLDIQGLREGPVLTLRLVRAGALDAERMSLAVAHGAPDDVGSCLGVPNQPASVLYAGGELFGGSYEARAREASSELELRGIRDQLDRNIQAALPKLREASESGRLILSIERPTERLMELYVIDLVSGRDLARLLAQAEGGFLTAKIDIGGVRPSSEGDPSIEVRGAVDCAVASQLRALLDAGPTSP